ncbi:pyruvate formate lyase family protein [Escherichia coli]
MLEENVHDILCSALVDDCIERAKSIKQGGAKYEVGFRPAGRYCQPRQQPGGGEKPVFDQGIIGQQELAKALAGKIMMATRPAAASALN